MLLLLETAAFILKLKHCLALLISHRPQCIHCFMHHCSLLHFCAFTLGRREILWENKYFDLTKKPSPSCCRKQIAHSSEHSYQEFSGIMYPCIIAVLRFQTELPEIKNVFVLFIFLDLSWCSSSHISEQNGDVEFPLPAWNNSICIITLEEVWLVEDVNHL